MYIAITVIDSGQHFCTTLGLHSYHRKWIIIGKWFTMHADKQQAYVERLVVYSMETGMNCVHAAVLMIVWFDKEKNKSSTAFSFG